MPTGTGSGTGTGGTPAPSSPNWFKRNWVGLTAGVIAIAALVAGVKGCNRSADVDGRIDGVEANVDSLLVQQQEVIDVVNNHTTLIQQNRREIDALKTRMSAAEDSINVHREAIDSLTMRVDSLETRVDTIAARQERCPCINQRARRPAAQCPSRPARPVRRDTVVVVVKPENVVVPGQSANGCGDDQNANVVIHGNNNTVNISNNGNNGAVAKSDTTRTVTRRVSASCSSTLVVNTVVTRNSYCK
ncbi:MAG: hypothetical protein ACI4NZ_01240 [Candidatus Enterousia sp.]